jgi:hypothetical protein
MNLKLSSTGLLTVDNSVLAMYPVGTYQYRVSYNGHREIVTTFPLQLSLRPGVTIVQVTASNGTVVQIGDLTIYAEDLSKFYRSELKDFTNRSWRMEQKYRREHLELDQARFEFASGNTTGSTHYVNLATPSVR